MNFNVMSTLLAVSSAHDTVHIFKLGPQKPQKPEVQSPASETGSLDSPDGALEAGGYEAFIDKKKNGSSVSYVYSSLDYIGFCLNGRHRSSLRRRSLHLTKNITSSVGGYLPNTLTEMWEPSRDFAFLRLPTSGSRCVVALSG